MLFLGTLIEIQLVLMTVPTYGNIGLPASTKSIDATTAITDPCTRDLDMLALCPEYAAKGLCGTYLPLWCSCPYSCRAPPLCQTTPIKDSTCNCGSLASTCETDSSMPQNCVVTCLTRTAIFCDVNLIPIDKTKHIEYTSPIRYLDSVTRTCSTSYQAVYGIMEVFVCQVDTSLKLDYSRDELICGDSCAASLNFNSSTCEYWASVGECIFKLDYWCRCSFSCKVAPFCQKVGNHDRDCQCGIWAKAGRCDEPEIQIKCETTCQLRKTVTCAESQLPSAPGYAFQYTSPIRYLDTVTIECAKGFDTTVGDYIHMACLANGSFSRSFYHSAITCIDPIKPQVDDNTDVCVCGCHVVYSNVSEYEVAKQKSLQIQDDLLVDTRNLSATIRKKISIPDYRPSAQGVGSLAVIILCSTVGCFILLDLRAFSLHLRMFKSNIFD